MVVALILIIGLLVVDYLAFENPLNIQLGLLHPKDELVVVYVIYFLLANVVLFLFMGICRHAEARKYKKKMKENVL